MRRLPTSLFLTTTFAAMLASSGCFVLDRADALEPGSVRGVAVDAGRDGVADVAVSLRGLQPPRRSTGDGAFVIGGLPAGPHALRLTHDVDGDGVPERGAAGAFTIQRRLEELAGVDLGTITLLGALQISGTVVDAAGIPVDGTTGELVVTHLDVDASTEARASIGADGTFILEGVLPGEVTLLAVVGSDSAVATVDLVGNDASGVVLTLAPSLPARVEASLTPAVDGARVVIVAPGAGPLGTPAGAANANVFVDVPPGRYDVWLFVGDEVRGFLGDQIALPGVETSWGPALDGGAGCVGDECVPAEGEGEGEGEPNTPPTADLTPIPLNPRAATTGTYTVADVDGDDVTVTIDVQPRLGTVTLTGPAAFTFLPTSPGRGGFDAVTLGIDDGTTRVSAVIPLLVGDRSFLTGNADDATSWTPVGVPGPGDVLLFPDTGAIATFSATGPRTFGALHGENANAVVFSTGTTVTVIGDVELPGGSLTGGDSVIACAGSASPAACRVTGTFEGLSVNSGTVAELSATQLELLGSVDLIGPGVAVTGLAITTGTTTLQGGNVIVAGDIVVSPGAVLGGAAGVLAFTGDLVVDGTATIAAPAVLSCGSAGELVNVTPTIGGTGLSTSTLGRLVVVDGVTCTPLSEVSIAGLKVGAGATFNPGDTAVVVTGDIEVDATATVTAQNLQAEGGTLRGTLPGGTSINGTVFVDGDVVVAGFASIGPRGRVDLGGARPGHLTVQTSLRHDGAIAFGAGGALTAESLSVGAGAILDLGGTGTMTLTGSFQTLAVSSSAIMVRGAARGHRTVFTSGNAVIQGDAGATIALEDVELAANTFFDVSNGGIPLTLVVDDLIVGAGAGVFTNTSTLTVEGTCTGAGACPP